MDVKIVKAAQLGIMTLYDSVLNVYIQGGSSGSCLEPYVVLEVTDDA